MGQTQFVLKNDQRGRLSQAGKDIDMDARSEARAKVGFSKFQPGRVTMLPYGVVDDRQHKDPFVIKEQFEEYANFDKTSYFASSLDDHDRYIEIDSAKEKNNSSLAGWYQPGEEYKSAKKRPKRNRKRGIDYMRNNQQTNEPQTPFQTALINDRQTEQPKSASRAS